MKGNQFSVKIYETMIESIEDEAEFISFFDTNYELFKDHLINIKGEISRDMKDYLSDKSLYYIQNTNIPKSRSKKEIKDTIEAEQIKSEQNQKDIEDELAKLSHRLQNNLKVLDTIVRSGQELKIDGDLLLLNRVNSGATIETSGNLIITQVVEGDIRCNGGFLMVNASQKANIIFNGIVVENEKLEDRLNRIELKNHRLVITPVLKKEINWA